MAEMDHEKRNRLERVWKYSRPKLFENSGEDPQSVTPEAIYQRWCDDWRSIQKSYLAFVWDPWNWRDDVRISMLKPRQEIPEYLPLDIKCAIQIRRGLFWNLEKCGYQNPEREIWVMSLKAWAGPRDLGYFYSFDDYRQQLSEYSDKHDLVMAAEFEQEKLKKKREFLHRIQFGYKKPFEG